MFSRSFRRYLSAAPRTRQDVLHIIMTKTATTTTAPQRVVHHWGGNGSLTRLEIHRIWRKLMLTVRNFWERRSKRKLRIVLALSATTVKPKKLTLPLQNTVWFGAWLPSG
ncbi:uncharacterized protein LOC109430201 isoform X2 [Aedes albopictus]|uniref:Secreted protein n=1 Tax=Aedes albopictus TaxID=7160 RepID=A0ABM1ZG93_AEDAL